MGLGCKRRVCKRAQGPSSPSSRGSQAELETSARKGRAPLRQERTDPLPPSSPLLWLSLRPASLRCLSIRHGAGGCPCSAELPPSSSNGSSDRRGNQISPSPGFRLWAEPSMGTALLLSHLFAWGCAGMGWSCLVSKADRCSPRFVLPVGWVEGWMGCPQRTVPPEQTPHSPPSPSCSWPVSLAKGLGCLKGGIQAWGLDGSEVGRG